MLTSYLVMHMTSNPVKAASLSDRSYLQRVAALHRELLIPPNYTRRGLVFHYEARELVTGDIGRNGKEMLMEPRTAESWKRMKAAAAVVAVVLTLDHAYRSVEFQADVIRRELARGSTLEKIMTFVAAPGYSEHHTGRALDIACPGCSSNDFDKTAAFGWLTAYAVKFGFCMSYPCNNPQGIIFEPWHWCFNE